MMRRLTCIALILLMASSVFAASEPKKEDQKKVDQKTEAQKKEDQKMEEQKTLYALGFLMAQNLSVFDLSPAEFDIVQQGMKDAIVTKKPAMADIHQYGEKVQALAEARFKAQGEKQAVAGKEYLEKAAKEKGAVKTESGAIYIPVKVGTGASPKATDTVKVNYRGMLIDGKEFDSSYKRGTPTEFPLSNVVKCWTEGIQKMKAGGSAKLVCPPALAYGENGRPPIIPPGATLVFDVDLLEVNPPHAAPATPAAPAK